MGSLATSEGRSSCSHYKRRCKIRAPCCDEVFDCRHCHNQAKNDLSIHVLNRHDLPHHDALKVICSNCETEQEATQSCINCGICMGEYFCAKCTLYDNDVSKNHFHCDECGICRTGGKENFFHCKTCRFCYDKTMKDAHRCVENAMHHNCAICFEFLFDTHLDIAILPCWHTIHLQCMKEMEKHDLHACPVCLKSISDMSKIWKKLDDEISAMPMLEPYLSKIVWILCNDCGATCRVRFHFLGHKCLNCKSYNTRKT